MSGFCVIRTRQPCRSSACGSQCYPVFTGLATLEYTVSLFFSFLKAIAVRTVFFLILLAAGWHAPCHADNLKSRLPAPMTTRGESPWVLNADKLVSLDDGVIVEATGNVLLQRGTDYLKADLARYYTATNWIFIKGHVEARMGRDSLNADEAEFDLHSRTGWLKNGSIFIAGPHMYVTGRKVDKLYGDRYVFKNARVTTCDGDTPAWSLAADNAEIEIDGYARLTHTTLNIKNVPLMDAPWMILPAKTTRQSGLLFPDFGYSTMNGAFYSQPLFQVLDESRDMTWNATYMSKVGFMPGIEYRSHTRPGEKTWLGLDFLYDTHTFRDEGGDTVNTGDGNVNTRKKRYWLRGMGNGELGGSGWKYRYNLDYVSDQNFLTQFKSMNTGFNSSRDSLYDMFGRDLPEVDQNRVTEGYVYKEWDRFMLSVGARYEQRPELGHGNADRRSDTTVQRIPFNAWLFRSRILKNAPFEIQGEVSTAYEYRRNGIRGLRTEIHPELSVPVALPGFSLLVRGGVRQTFYNSSHEHAVDGKPWTYGKGNRSRFVPDFSAAAFTQFSRSWDWRERALPATAENSGKWSVTGMMHRIQPRVEYSWTPEKDQSDNPVYEELDRIIPWQRVRLSVTNILTARKTSVSGAKGKYSATDSYFDPLRWELATGYDFEEANRTNFVRTYARKPVLDTYSALEFSPADWLTFWNRIYVSMHGDGVTRSDTGLKLSHAVWGSWSIAYSQRNKYYDYITEMKRDNAEDVSLTPVRRLMTNIFRFNPTKTISLYYLTTDNLVSGKNYERRFILGYHHQCFNILGAIHSKNRDNSYRIILQLPGLSL